MKCLSLDKHCCTCLLRSISGISTYSRQITALCRCVRDDSAEKHAWLKMYHACGKQKRCIPLSSWITFPYVFNTYGGFAHCCSDLLLPLMQRVNAAVCIKQKVPQNGMKIPTSMNVAFHSLNTTEFFHS